MARNQKPEPEPNFEGVLTLVSFKKDKATEQRSGWVLRFTTPLNVCDVDDEIERETMKVKHGRLRLTRLSMYADPGAPQTPEHVKAQAQAREERGEGGNVTMSFGGKLKRTMIGAAKEGQPRAVWVFTLSSDPTDEDLRVLIAMARANGDSVESTVQGAFWERAEKEKDEPQGPELFGEEEAEPDLDPRDEEFMPQATLGKGEFEEAAEEAKDRKSSRRRRVAI